MVKATKAEMRGKFVIIDDDDEEEEEEDVVETESEKSSISIKKWLQWMNELKRKKRLKLDISFFKGGSEGGERERESLTVLELIRRRRRRRRRRRINI